jgi:pSer/pThr/pTyr-binding forkhead associated (FHA) protein
MPVGMLAAFRVKLTGKSLLLGRGKGCDAVLPLPTVSKHHCRVFRSGRHWVIEDLGSRNGTFVNHRRIRRKRLKVGDVIGVADVEFEVR